MNLVADTTTALMHVERRFDPFFRPAFDALLRDPIANVVTALMNSKRPNEGLKIAQEKPLPNEEAYLDSIISSFNTHFVSVNYIYKNHNTLFYMHLYNKYFI